MQIYCNFQNYTRKAYTRISCIQTHVYMDIYVRILSSYDVSIAYFAYSFICLYLCASICDKPSTEY